MSQAAGEAGGEREALSRRWLVHRGRGGVGYPERTVDDALIRPATPDDAAAIAAIYNHYVTHTTVTFEEQPVSGEDMSERLREVAAASLPWLVAVQSGQVVGYAYATKWKGRCAYRYSVESSVYLAHDRVGKGLGSLLYRELFSRLKDRGIHAIIGGIALPNPASVALHERLGMTQVAHFREVGFKFGGWIDVGYWQATLR